MPVSAQLRRPGRPREPVPADVANELLEWIAEGKPLTAFCAQPGRPSRRTVHDWREKDSEFHRQFEFAREFGFWSLSDEILEIADEPRPAGAGRAWLTRQRERIRVRFWLLSRWYPKGPPRRRRSGCGAGAETVKPEVRVVEKAP